MELVVCIIDDDAFCAKALKHNIERNPDYKSFVFDSAQEFFNQDLVVPDAITLDFNIPNEDCELTLTQSIKRWPDTPVLVISAQENISTAVNLLQKGAYDYLEKNSEVHNRLLNNLKNIEKSVDLNRKVKSLQKTIERKFNFKKSIKGSSPKLQKVFERMNKAIQTNITVSIYGETGTGKELVAKAIHYNSNRSKHPMVSLNVAAIPNELLESELFGHEKGAYTGAYASRKGRLEEANGGSIFLDEIAEMNLATQAKLLRVLQEREITPLGGNRSVKLDVRILVATHKDLASEVEKGNFRQDLYYRLLGLPIHLPPLRERPSDILILSRFFMDEFCKENGLDRIKLSEESKMKLVSYTYPGNVRELKAIVELAIVMSDGAMIEANDISYVSTQNAKAFINEEKSLRAFNMEIIRHFLDKYDGDVILVANKLGIGKSTIYRMLKEEKMSLHGEALQS